MYNFNESEYIKFLEKEPIIVESEKIAFLGVITGTALNTLQSLWGDKKISELSLRIEQARKLADEETQRDIYDPILYALDENRPSVTGRTGLGMVASILHVGDVMAVINLVRDRSGRKKVVNGLIFALVYKMNISCDEEVCRESYYNQIATILGQASLTDKQKKRLAIGKKIAHMTLDDAMR